MTSRVAIIYKPGIMFHIQGELTLDKIIALVRHLDELGVHPHNRTLAVDEQELLELVASYTASMSPNSGWLDPSLISVSTLYGFKFFRTDLSSKHITKTVTFVI